MEKIISKEQSIMKSNDFGNKYHKSMTGIFFEFMKTAHEVNNNTETKQDTFKTSSPTNVDWNYLARVNLDTTTNDESYLFNNIKDDKNIKTPLETNDAATGENKIKILKSNDDSEEVEYPLGKLVKRKLSDILHEGLLDSILPYMLPRATVSQPQLKKTTVETDVKKCISLNNVHETKTIPALSKSKDKEKIKSMKTSLENEVEIHVCDEAKNVTKNFHCPQKLLIQKMQYFADVTSGQKLEEIDISVHCDIVIFDWLMRWVKKDLIKKSEWPVLESNNVIPIMVSSSFLQMEPLLEDCLEFCHNNMSEILKTSSALTCLNDTLLTRLADLFTNEDVEILKDKRDKIQSRLFCKLIMSLENPVADNKRGHFGSLATLFRCEKCGKNIIRSVSRLVPCVSSSMRIDSRGNVFNKHTRDLNWVLNDYIVALRSELCSWRKVYWRLWGDCHFLFCQQCESYFSVHQMDWCCYHPERAQFFVNDQQRPTPFPLGRYPCCSQRAYRSEVLRDREGCKYREHVPSIKTEQDLGIVNIFSTHRDIITIEPPQLVFPEKITRLVTRDPSFSSGKLTCKETMWWNGIELVPPRPKLGLLGKVWGGSLLRRNIEGQEKSCQKLNRQVSQTTTEVSFHSSGLDSDEEDCETGCNDSSGDEESYLSEESNTWSVVKPSNPVERKIKYQSIGRFNNRRWSPNLLVRYNQDNQRDFEEKAATQMIALLTKRTSVKSNLLSKPVNKQHLNYKHPQPIGGSYVKLEAEFRSELAHSYKNKNSNTVKSLFRTKANKLL